MEGIKLVIRKNSKFDVIRNQTVALTLITTAFSCLAMFATVLDDLGKRQGYFCNELGNQTNA